MAKKKSKSFGKHIYVLAALVVLVVAAGIASYATAPAGVATHGTLYTDNIQGKTGPLITIRDDSAASTLLRVENTGANGLGIYATAGDTAVAGLSSGSGNSGNLGTLNAGVEGTSGTSNGRLGYSGYGAWGSGATVGVYGTTSAGTAGVYGTGGSTGVYGTGSTFGVYGVSAAGYSGYFDGGRGLYASKVEFGSDAFSASNGLLVLYAGSGTACNTVCTNHGGLSAGLYGWRFDTGTMTQVTSSSTTGLRFCMCD